MDGFLPIKLREELLREYLIVHWTDRTSDQPNFLPNAIKEQGGIPWRCADLDREHSVQILDLLKQKYNTRDDIDQMVCVLHKMYDKHFINDCSHSSFIISLTNNDVKWYDTFAEQKVSLPYNEAFDTTGMTLSLPTLENNSYYFIDIFLPENA